MRRGNGGALSVFVCVAGFEVSVKAFLEKSVVLPALCVCTTAVSAYRVLCVNVHIKARVFWR